MIGRLKVDFLSDALQDEGCLSVAEAGPDGGLLTTNTICACMREDGSSVECKKSLDANASCCWEMPLSRQTFVLQFSASQCAYLCTTDSPWSRALCTSLAQDKAN